MTEPTIFKPGDRIRRKNWIFKYDVLLEQDGYTQYWPESHGGGPMGFFPYAEGEREALNSERFELVTD